MLAMECAMDELAYKAGLEPLSFRQKTCIDQASPQHLMGRTSSPSSCQNSSMNWRNRRAIGRDEVKSSALTRVGNADKRHFFESGHPISFTTTHLNQAGSLINIFEDGSIEVNHGGTEMGQGLFTKIKGIVAREFGVDVG